MTRSTPAHASGQLALPSYDPPEDPTLSKKDASDDDTGRAGLVRSVEVRRSARRKRTVAARLEGGNLIVFLPAR
ncbi:MAG TPA: hypothetical protein VJ010_09890, partial [Actinomycetota bacterium]|nr:hypothetical protein [Actinomycetota bacterium]